MNYTTDLKALKPNTSYSSLLRNFLPKIPTYLLYLFHGGKSLQIFTQRNHSQNVGFNAKNSVPNPIFRLKFKFVQKKLTNILV